MTTPSSSPRIPMSPDLSRRRLPRPKDKRRALRDFYGIKANQDDGPVEHDAILDAPDFSVSSYLLKLDEDKSAIKSLLQLENRMIREIRVLDGERKALVYDNYGRMISATDTIKHVTTEMQPMTKETFSPILTSITQLTSDIDAHTENGRLVHNENAEDDNDDPKKALDEWIKDGPNRVRDLLAAGLFKIAQDELNDIKKDLPALSELDKQEVELALNDLAATIAAKIAEQEAAVVATTTPG